MIGNTEGVCRSVIVVVPGGSCAPTSAMRARTSLSAWIMSVPGAKSISSCAAPRTDLDRTRSTPSTMPTTSSIGRVTATSTSLTARPGDLRDDDDPGEGDLGIDPAGHAQHRHDAGGRQQRRGQDDQAEVGPGPGDEVHPALGALGAGRRGPLVAVGSHGRGARIGGQAHGFSSAWPAFASSALACSAFSSSALACSAFSSPATRTGVFSGRL